MFPKKIQVLLSQLDCFIEKSTIQKYITGSTRNKYVCIGVRVAAKVSPAPRNIGAIQIVEIVLLDLIYGARNIPKINVTIYFST